MLNVVRNSWQMSLLNIGLLSIGLLFSVLTAEVSAENWADKMFAQHEHDFRTVGRGTKCEFHFEMTNPYEEEVHIAAVRTSCGCTTPTLTTNTLKTHQSGAVVATFNTATHIGQKAATVTVVFDKPYYAEVQLKVSGYIRTDITFEPPEVAYGEIPAGQSREREVVITHSGNSNWTITDVRSHCTNLQVRLNAPERSAGTVRYRMLVRMDEQMPEGEIHERLTLISNDRNFPTTEMAISGRIRPVVSVSPAAISLGTTQSGSVVEKRLVVRGDQPFAIKDVVCGDERFEFEVPEGRKKVHFLKLRFVADDQAGRVAQQIKIVTDLGENKTAACVATGTIGPASL